LAGPLIAGVIVIVLGVLVLLGWAVGSGLLTSVIPGLPSMKVNTALALMCAAVAVLCLALGTGVMTRRIGQLLALVLAVFGVLVICEYLFGGLGFDQAFAHDVAGSFPGRPSPETALALMVLG